MSKPSKSKAEKVKCPKCGQWKESKTAWCPNYRSHGSRYPIRQKRFVNPPATDTGSFPSLLQSAENERRLQLEDRAAPKAAWIETPVACYLVGQVDSFDEKVEHEKDLEYESRVDYASWATDPQEAE